MTAPAEMIRVRLSCGHRGDAPANEELRRWYPDTFCVTCDDVKPIPRRKAHNRMFVGASESDN